MVVTAYTIGPESTGIEPWEIDYGITASGERAVPGITIAAPDWIPFGSRIQIPGFGMGIVEDRGGAVQGNHLDVCLSSVSQAVAWGREWEKVIIYWPIRR